jgi:uncharacterized protein YjbI with pentapeptide repeats
VLLALVVLVLLAGGLALWLPHQGATSNADSDLGLMLIGGALAVSAAGLVSYAVFVAQQRFDLSLRASDEARERTSLQLALASAPTLAGIDLSGRELTRIILRGRDMHRADLSNARLTFADLSGTDLSVAILANAKLHGANLSGADLTNATLNDADLSFANLAGADLSGASLSHCILAGADFTDANLANAWLIDSKFYGADLSGAVLIGSSLTGASLAGAKYTAGTQWPNNFDPDSADAVLIKRRE